MNALIWWRIFKTKMGGIWWDGWR